MPDFKGIAAEYFEREYFVVPAIDKAPFLHDYYNLSEKQIMSADWSRANGINILTGKKSGVILLDLDILKDKKPDAYEDVMKLVPQPFCARVGNPNKPPAIFFQYNGEQSRSFRYIDVEILSDNKNACIPPTLHPDFDKQYEWMGIPLLCIEKDELPTLSKDIIDALDDLNEQYRTQKKQGKADYELTLEAGRCKHNSHNHLSSIGVAMCIAGEPFNKIIERLDTEDKKINADADFTYFECPKRAEFRGLTREAALRQFVGQIFSRNAKKIDFTQNVLITSDEIAEEMMLPKADKTCQELWEAAGVTVTRQGNPILNEANVLKLIRKDSTLADAIYYDAFVDRIHINDRPISDNDLDLFIIKFQTVYGLQKISKNMLKSAMQSYAVFNRKNPFLDFLDSCEWDGEPRVDSFFQKTCGCEDNEYHQAVSKSFWLSMVARGMWPGCKVDTMIVLEGPQGAAKSTLLETIAKPWFTESTTEIGTKDWQLSLKGNLIIEIGELDSFNKASVTTIKNMLTVKADDFRDPYAHFNKKNNRTCVFAGTTNSYQYLRDETGNRRFLPVRIVKEKLDIAYAKEFRKQLFAESRDRLKRGEKWWADNSIFEEEQEARRDVDPWEDALETYFMANSDISSLRADFILETILGVEIKHQNRGHSIRLGRCMRALGWEYKNKRDKSVPGKKPEKYWLKITA